MVNGHILIHIGGRSVTKLFSGMYLGDRLPIPSAHSVAGNFLTMGSIPELVYQGPVVQNFISLTLSLSPHFVNCISTSKANTLLLFVEKM